MKSIMSLPRHCTLFLLACLLATGCHAKLPGESTPLAIFASTQTPAFVAEEFHLREPATVAILPFEDARKDKDEHDRGEVSHLLRTLFYNNFSSLPYSDIELEMIDARLGTTAAGDLFTSQNAVAAGRQINSDAVIVARIKEFTGYYAGFYGSITADIELKMYDTHEGTLLWSTNCMEVSHRLDVPLSPFSAVLSAAQNALYLQRINYVHTANALFMSIVGTIPLPLKSRGRELPRFTFLAHDGIGHPLKSGDLLNVVAEGTPGLEGEARVGELVMPLREEEPGRYKATYRVAYGDAVEDGILIATLKDARGLTALWRDTTGFIWIDGQPPPIPSGLKAVVRDGSVHLSWHPIPEVDLAGYHVLRSTTPLAGYEEITVVQEASFVDHDAPNGVRAYYRVRASDRTGNMGPETLQVDVMPLPPGPTEVRGPLTEDTHWYQSSSPYVCAEQLVVPKGVTLHIHRGTTVLFQTGAGITVKGALMSEGTADEPVLFTSTGDSLWDGIAISGGNASSIHQSIISGAHIGLTISNASPEVRYTVIKQCGLGLRITGERAEPALVSVIVIENSDLGLLVEHEAAPWIKLGRFTHNVGDGIRVIGARASLLACEASFNTTGIILDKSSIRLNGNAVHSNSAAGLVATGMDAAALAIDYNYWGAPESVRVINGLRGIRNPKLKVFASLDHSENVVEVPVRNKTDAGHPQSEEFRISTQISSKTTNEAAEGSLSAQRLQQGIDLARQRAFDEALPLLLEAVRSPREEAEARFWLGYCYLETGNTLRALASYYAASRLDENNPEYLLHVGATLHLLGRLEESATIYREILKHHPDHAQAREFLAVVEEGAL
ncbi:MAG: tetratricopeptide repeat protein [Desulfovibrionaceae bacterium]